MPSLDRKEWDFSEKVLPDDELFSCYHYEYARENESIKKAVLHWRKEIGGDLNAARKAALKGKHSAGAEPFPKALDEIAPSVGESCYLQTAEYLLVNTSYPHTPWRGLKDTDKGAWSRTFDIHRALIESQEKSALRWLTLSGHNVEEFVKASWLTGSGSKAPKATRSYVAFEVDWRNGVEKVIQEFEAWARKRWKELECKKGKRTTYRERLRQLGVMRLYASIGNWEKVMEYLKQKGGEHKGGGFSTVGECCRSGRAARGRKVFPLKWEEPVDEEARQWVKKMPSFS